MDEMYTIGSYLAGLTQEDCTLLIVEHCWECPELRASILSEIKSLPTGNNLILYNLRTEVSDICNKNYDFEKDTLPDMSGVIQKMHSLLDLGFSNELFEYSEECLRELSKVDYDYENDWKYEEFHKCCDLLIVALEKSKLSTTDKILWALGITENDNYIYSYRETYIVFLNELHDKKAWSKVANILLAKYNGTDIEGTTAYSLATTGSMLSHWIVHALDYAGRRSKVISFCKMEARKNGNYTTLVQKLVDYERYDEAMRWIQEGISKADPEKEHEAGVLRYYLKQIFRAMEDWNTLMMYEIDDYLRRPNVQSYFYCEKAAEELSIWPELREALLQYIEQGTAPWTHAKWPFPGYLFEPLPKFSDRARIEGRINIALYEKNAQDALKWFEKHISPYIDEPIDLADKVADCAKNEIPESAILIWKSLVSHFLHADDGTHMDALDYLRKIKEVMLANGMEEDWQAYLTSIREKHQRKEDLMQVISFM
jgi:uncharacterized Zn finger protein